jgi:hypothetical protein
MQSYRQQLRVSTAAVECRNKTIPKGRVLIITLNTRISNNCWVPSTKLKELNCASLSSPIGFRFYNIDQVKKKIKLLNNKKL